MKGTPKPAIALSLHGGTSGGGSVILSVGRMKLLDFRPCPPLGCLMACVTIGLWLGGVALPAWADQVRVDCQLNIFRDGTNAVVFWQLPTECGTNLCLQSASSAGGPWSTLTNPEQPFLLPLYQGGDGFFRAVLAMPAGSANSSQITQWVRDFAFSSRTNLNPATEFDIRLEPVGGLWDTMQVQVMIVRESVGGQLFNEYACLLHEGKVQTLGQSFGGYGLMSGLMQGASFYFTYSWGSGIHRSHLGKLQIVSDELKFWDSGGFPDLDLFLLREPDGTIAVVTGRFEGFNRWREAAEYGQIDETDPSATKLIGLDGRVLAILLPDP